MSNNGFSSLVKGSAPVLGTPLLASVLGTLADISIVVNAQGQVQAALTKPDSIVSGDAAQWPGRDLFDLIAPDSIDVMQARMSDVVARAAGGEAAPFRWVEVEHRLRSGVSVPVRYAIHWIATSGDLLLLGQDQRPVIEIQQQLLNAQVALERDHEAQREIDTRYRLLMDFTNDSIVLVSMASGQIADVNHNAAALLGASRAELLGMSFAALFAGRKKDELLSAISTSASMESVVAVEIEVQSTQRLLLMRGKLFRAAGGQFILVRLEDHDAGASADSQLVANLRQLFYRGVDAMVFTNKDGVIQAASESFLNLTDAPGMGAVRGRSVADFLARGVVDLRVLLDNARRAGQLRMYSTKLKTDFDAQLPVEISATWLDERVDPVLALIIRNASNSAALRAESPLPDTNMRGVMELVGSSTLKDIVSETTNVIEKICIETAIELTRNNRVAAAEMLGLSRQSLYVKLRKYDMLSREEE